MTAVAVLVLALAAMLAGCGGNGDGAPTTPRGTATPAPLPGGELVRCESPAGFALGRPRSWSMNSGDVVPACTRLHPEPFRLQEATDERVAAISADIEPVPFARVTAPGTARDVKRAVTTIDGLRAVRLEYQSTGEALWPSGTPITAYAIDLATAPGGEPRTLLLDTIGLPGFAYARNRVVLDRVARSVDVTHHGVATAPDVVARYETRGGFTVEGEVRDSTACLRMAPDGEPVCTDIPARDQIHTIRLSAGEPVLAGVAGADVFRVVAERRGGGSASVLPAPIRDNDVRGFAYPFALADVVRLRLYDLTGTELRTIAPGG